MTQSLITSSWICHSPPSIQPGDMAGESRNYCVFLFGTELAAWESRLHKRTGLLTSAVSDNDLVDLIHEPTANLECCFLIVCLHHSENFEKAKSMVAALQKKQIQIVLIINTPTRIENAKQAPEYSLGQAADFSVLFHSPLSLADDLKQAERENRSALYSSCAAVEELLIDLF